LHQLEDPLASSRSVILNGKENIMTHRNSLFRQPSAFLPVALSFMAFALVFAHVALFGIAHQTDEGTAAHLWQLLLVLQIPIMAFFLIKYVPHQPKQALLILALQITAALVACAPVFFLHL
jgi:hypothetical protein